MEYGCLGSRTEYSRYWHTCNLLDIVYTYRYHYISMYFGYTHKCQYYSPRHTRHMLRTYTNC
jgi:hypothetical protein